MLKIFKLIAALLLAALVPVAGRAELPSWPGAKEGDAELKDFRFTSGETFKSLRIHWLTLGTPNRDEAGNIDNAVLVLHGTGGTGRQFLQPQFANELYGPGQPLDLAKTYVILADGLGHGQSSKPSDGLRMRFPNYGYADMVSAQYRLLTEALGVTRLKLILGTSMGCMHAFVWGEAYPGFAERLAPFACNTVEIAGRNRMWRQMSIDAIKADPAWQGGDYTVQPAAGLRASTALAVIAGANPVALQAQLPTAAAVAAALPNIMTGRGEGVDANDRIYQLDASRDYNPSARLGEIKVPVLWINSADDFINPPELGIAPVEARKLPNARFILIPASAETKGHGTHTWAKFWKADLAKLLAAPGG